MKIAITMSVVVLSLMGLSACGSSSSGYNTGTGTSTGTGGSSRNSREIGVLNGHLVDASGFALYITNSSCTGSCLTIWPPVDASADPSVSGGANSGLVGLSGGQVTYNGHALYYFESDTASGEATGNGVGGFSLATP